jgi:predicted metal-dependent RNase
MYLIEVNGSRILMECGLYQGHRDEAIERNRKFTFDPATLDAVVLSHAHIDHCGNLPNLCRQGFRGNIYSTFATRDLAAVMLADSAAIQRADAEFVSKKRIKEVRLEIKMGHQAIQNEQIEKMNNEEPHEHVDAKENESTISEDDAAMEDVQAWVDEEPMHKKARA